ncbi:MAG: cation diffusion facilitator family transporter [Bacteroidota bacterium]
MNIEQQNLSVQKRVALASTGILVSKFWAYFATHSVSILTDALESIVNVTAGFIGLYSLYVAAQPKDKEHPYGHGKAEFISAAIEGTLIALAGCIILYQSVWKLIEPTPVHELDLGIGLVAGTSLLNFALAYYCLRIGKKNHSLALIASGQHLRTDALSTLGIVAGLVLLYFTDWPWLDPVMAIGFGVYIVYTGYGIVRHSIGGIMDEADHVLLGQFVELLDRERQSAWIDLHNLRVIRYGTKLHVDCHLTLPWFLNIHEAHREVDALSAKIRSEFGESIELFVHTDGCMPFSCKICDRFDCKVRQHDFEKKLTWTPENLLSDAKHQIL